LRTNANSAGCSGSASGELHPSLSSVSIVAILKVIICKILSDNLLRFPDGEEEFARLRGNGRLIKNAIRTNWPDGVVVKPTEP
jgi:hypothetical protein